MFEEVSKKLGCEVRTYSPPYRPQSNSKIECFHKFLKACMGKHISKNLKEWDDFIPMATGAYNFFPHTTNRERLFFLMFGRDPLTGLQQLLGETMRYLGEGKGKLDLTALQNTYQLAAQNVQMARKRNVVDEPVVTLAFQPDLVTLRYHTAKAFDPKYKGEYRVIKYLGKTQVLLRNSKGEEAKHHVAYLKKTKPVQETVEKILDFRKFGRVAKLRLNPYRIPDLKWEYEVTEIVMQRRVMRRMSTH